MKKSQLYLALTLSGGVIMTLTGLAFIAMYVWEAVILRLGDPDQSLLFWYLPILFLGIFISTGGIVLLIAGIKRLRKKR